MASQRSLRQTEKQELLGNSEGLRGNQKIRDPLLIEDNIEVKQEDLLEALLKEREEEEAFTKYVMMDDLALLNAKLEAQLLTQQNVVEKAATER